MQGRKTLSFQRRQVFVNVCCIGLCPILMVLIAGAMGIVITHLINNLSTPSGTVDEPNCAIRDEGEKKKKKSPTQQTALPALLSKFIPPAAMN